MSFPKFMRRAEPVTDGALEIETTMRVFNELNKLTPEAQIRVMQHVGGILADRAAYTGEEKRHYLHVVGMQ